MATWAPDLHTYYTQSLNALHQHHRSLKRIFKGSMFSSSTYNLGPETVCFKHRDFANLPFGWCGITAFGSFDPHKGGHLILWDLHLVIEFPPGSTVLIPSAVVAHSNVPISEGETRYSFTQYTAGQLFQWVANGFQTATSYKASLSPAEFAAYERRNEERWKFGLSLVPKFPLEDDKESSE